MYENGLSLIKIVRTEYPHIVTIMLTALYEMDSTLKAVNDFGMYKFFLMPGDREKHLLALRNTLYLFGTLLQFRHHLIQ